MSRITDEQIAVIKNDFEEKGWTAYRIWQEHPRFGCFWNAIEELIKKIKEAGSFNFNCLYRSKWNLEFTYSRILTSDPGNFCGFSKGGHVKNQ